MTEEKKTRSRKKPTAKTPIKKETGLTIPVYAPTGKIEKQISLPDEMLKVKISPKLIAQAVRVYLTNQRQGNASTKTRGEVAGSTRKIYRQKGTGRARHGDIKAPIFVGGGVVGGPRPKKYHLKINKKQKRLALLGALSYQYQKRNILGLSDQFLKIEPKTKFLADFFKKIKIDQEKKLIIVPKKVNNNLFLAARNIPFVEIITAESINSYRLLKAAKILMVEEAVKIIKKQTQSYENK